MKVPFVKHQVKATRAVSLSPDPEKDATSQNTHTHSRKRTYLMYGCFYYEKKYNFKWMKTKVKCKKDL